MEEQLELEIAPEIKPVRVLVPKGNTPKLGDVKVGQLLTVQLPDERTRGEVVEVIDQDHIRAKLIITPMSKTHSYRLGQSPHFHRVKGDMGDKWEVE